MTPKIIAKVLNFPHEKEKIYKLVYQWNSLPIDDLYILSSQCNDINTGKELQPFSDKLTIVIQTLLQQDNNSFPLAIKRDGTKAIGEGDGSWLKMLCPRGVDNGISITDYWIKEIELLIKTLNPKGISIDFIRNFVFWENIYENSIINSDNQTCFCSKCTSCFLNQESIKLPNNLDSTTQIADFILSNHRKAWEKFSSYSITNLAKGIIQKAKEIKPTLKVTFHIVPWLEKEFDFAKQRVAGQDIISLSKLGDYLSPMCYSPMLKRDDQWINTIVKDLSDVSNKPIIPAIQISPMYGTLPLDDNQFINMIKGTLKAPSSGVFVWPWEEITDNQFEILCQYLRDSKG